MPRPACLTGPAFPSGGLRPGHSSLLSVARRAPTHGLGRGGGRDVRYREREREGAIRAPLLGAVPDRAAGARGPHSHEDSSSCAQAADTITAYLADEKR